MSKERREVEARRKQLNEKPSQVTRPYAPVRAGQFTVYLTRWAPGQVAHCAFPRVGWGWHIERRELAMPPVPTEPVTAATVTA